MKAIKRSTSLLLIFATVFSLCVIPVNAVSANEPGTTYWDWVIRGTNEFTNKLAHIFDHSVCSACQDETGRHNFVERMTTVNGVTGDFYICEYCGKSAGEVLPTAYDDYVHDLPSTQYLNGGYLAAYPYITLAGTAVWREDGVEKSCVFDRGGVCPLFDIGSTYVDVLASEDNRLIFTKYIKATPHRVVQSPKL